MRNTETETSTLDSLRAAWAEAAAVAAQWKADAVEAVEVAAEVSDVAAAKPANTLERSVANTAAHYAAEAARAALLVVAGDLPAKLGQMRHGEQIVANGITATCRVAGSVFETPGSDGFVRVYFSAEQTAAHLAAASL